jgi:hypothetical protein
MQPVRKAVTKGFPILIGIIAGALLATSLGAGATPVQDPAVQLQIQQALNNFQIQLRNELNVMQMKIDSLEMDQQLQRTQRTLDANSGVPAISTPTDPIPGVTTFGRLVSQSVLTERIVANSARGDVLAQLGMTADGPGLVLYDATGAISMVLVATPGGAELRMADADGNLQTVLSGQ